MAHWTIKATSTENLVMVYWMTKARDEISEPEHLLMDAIKYELQVRGYNFGILTQEIKPVWNDNLSIYNVVIRYGNVWEEVKRGFGSYIAAMEWGLDRMSKLDSKE